MEQEPKVYEVTVEEVHSGDDLIIMVDLNIDGLYKRVRARLKGVDTPSAFKVGKDTEAGAVRDMLRTLVCNAKCSVALHAYGRGGWVVTLFAQRRGEPAVNINEVLIAKGYVYQGKQES